ncbi:Transcription factor IIIB 90 kDa subunit [Phytophthora cinnamomi]|uniref:Transcription factor IIIB 90 kDa subunit n=1 Tax=Phytophthora cinnamomi TaxID=4785 RepID=UPI00355964E2|nr:Transcription factor IIIB 90 kDa subunit [Phytophthora cinnamomi]
MELLDGGPQAERSRRLQAQGSVQPAPKPLPSVKTVPTVPSACVSGCCVESARLADERDFLRSYAERLLVQLRGLLQRYGELERLKTLADATQSEDEPHERLAPWLTASEYTNPLLQAYDLKIQELETALVDNKKAIDRVAARAEGLAKENTTLRQELEVAGEKMVLRMQNEPKEMHVMTDDLMNMQENGEYLQEINERIDVLMAENNMLMEQVSLQDDEIGAMKKELTDRDQQLQVMGQNFNDATLALQELRDACSQVREEKTHCERQLQRYAASIAQLESAKESLMEQTDVVRKERGDLENQLSEYEEMLEKMKRSTERKDEAFSARYQSVCVRLRELTNALEKKDKAVDELQERNSALQAELEAVRQDCEGMLNVLNSMEKQLTQYCAREDAVTELESECKAKVEEAILEKEEVAARELQSRREIARLLERLRQQAAEHAKTQEESMSTIVRKHEADMTSREQEIRSLNTELVDLRSKMEATARNQKEADKKLADAIRRSKDASIAFEKKLQHLSERATTAEEARDMSSHLEAEYLERIRSKEDALTKLRSEFRDRGQELNERISSLERELEMRRTEAREAKDESEEQHRKVQLLNDQLNKVKADCANRFTNEFEVLHQQNRDLKAQAAELEYKLSQAKKEAVSALDSSRNERERSEVRLIAEVESLKGRIQSLKEERKRTDKSRQEVEARCSVLSLQVQQLSRDLSDAKELLLEQEHACDDSDRKVSELSAQLTAALSKQQQFYRQERELRTALERMTLERSRMEREAMMARKKIEEYRSSSYTYLSAPHSRMHADQNDSPCGVARDVIANKYDPAEKTNARYQMPASSD